MNDAGGGDRSGPGDWVRWFLRTDDGVAAFVREVLGSVLAVVLVGLVLFAASGLWPPMVAVESGSMNPNLHRGDLVFVMEEHRFAAPAAEDGTGVVTYQTGERTGYRKFGRSGDVIVYRADGENGGTPIIHRARFWVNESENWYDKADPEAIGAARACESDDDPATDTALRNCPAPHAGFITKGDNPVQNERYDQVTGLSEPVRPSWIIGTAEFRIPYLGYVRLLFGQAAASPAGTGAGPAPPAALAGPGHLTA